MRVRDLIQRPTELDRENAEIGLMVFDRPGAVAILAAREAEGFDGRGNEIGFEEEPTAVLIVGGQSPGAPLFLRRLDDCLIGTASN